MIRLIDMSKDYWLYPERPGPFAFLDTVTNRFFEFRENQVWSCREDWESDVAVFENTDRESKELIERMRRLWPEPSSSGQTCP